MHLFDVRVEEVAGEPGMMLVAAGGAFEAYELVTNKGHLVQEVSLRDCFPIRGGSRIVAVVKEYLV